MKVIKPLSILKIAVTFIFIGRAYQHLFWDAPYRSFFWDEYLLKPIIENVFDISWGDYVTSDRMNSIIQGIIIGNGVLYLIAAVCSFYIHKKNAKWLRFPVSLGGISLILLALLSTKDRYYQFAQFFEHSIQFSLPFILVCYFRDRFSFKKKILVLKILIAVTFSSHGLYALGFYPVPGYFIDMVIRIFSCSESVAITFLYIAGIMDLVIAVFIFIPRFGKYALWYAVIWGILTALARIMANFYLLFPLQSVHQNLFGVLFRLSHGLVPFMTLLIIESIKVHNNNRISKKIKTI